MSGDVVSKLSVGLFCILVAIFSFLWWSNKELPLIGFIKGQLFLSSPDCATKNKDGLAIV